MWHSFKLFFGSQFKVLRWPDLAWPCFVTLCELLPMLCLQRLRAESRLKTYKARKTWGWILKPPVNNWVNTRTGKGLRITRPGKGAERYCPSLLSRLLLNYEWRANGEQYWTAPLTSHLTWSNSSSSCCPAARGSDLDLPPRPFGLPPRPRMDPSSWGRLGLAGVGGRCLPHSASARISRCRSRLVAILDFVIGGMERRPAAVGGTSTAAGRL